MIISISLNLGAVVTIGKDAIDITNLRLKIMKLEQDNKKLIKDSDDAISYLISQCRAMLQACSGGK